MLAGDTNSKYVYMPILYTDSLSEACLACEKDAEQKQEPESHLHRYDLPYIRSGTLETWGRATDDQQE